MQITVGNSAKPCVGGGGQIHSLRSHVLKKNSVVWVRERLYRQSNRRLSAKLVPTLCITMEESRRMRWADMYHAWKRFNTHFSVWKLNGRFSLENFGVGSRIIIKRILNRKWNCGLAQVTSQRGPAACSCEYSGSRGERKFLDKLVKDFYTFGEVINWRHK
jgi:hypothetical protein